MPEGSFLEGILEGGPRHHVVRRDDGASLRPIDDTEAALHAFQFLVDEVLRNDGDGYEVHLTHKCADRPGDLVDLVLLRIEG
jgi:hypothetical protein